MSSLRLVFHIDTDAFQPTPGQDPLSARDKEIARILRDLAARFDYGPTGESPHGYTREHPRGRVVMAIFDRNDHLVGGAHTTED
jgi:hypothetical protein